MGLAEDQGEAPLTPKHRILAAILGTAIVISAQEVAEQHRAPRPRQFVAAWFVFLVLSLAAEFGEGPARVASAFAIVTFLGVLMTPSSVRMFSDVARVLGGDTPAAAAPSPLPTKGSPA